MKDPLSVCYFFGAAAGMGVAGSQIGAATATGMNPAVAASAGSAAASGLTAGQGIGLGLILAGNIGGALASRNAYAAQSRMARANAVLARAAAARNAERYRSDARRRIEAARARMGTMNVSLSSPSYVAALTDMARREEENAALIEYRGEIADAQNRAQASYYDRQGDVSLLTGATQAFADTAPLLLE